MLWCIKMKYHIIRNKNLFNGGFYYKMNNKRHITNTNYYFKNRNLIKSRQLKGYKNIKQFKQVTRKNNKKNLILRSKNKIKFIIIRYF